MTPDEMEKRLKNALIYGTSHPEAYMTKADDLWEKYKFQDVYGSYVPLTQFLAALAEYGEAVRAEAVSVCKELEDKRHGNAHNFACEDCAAAIETMKLP